MRLCIDIGNTQTKAALYENNTMVTYWEAFGSDEMKRVLSKYAPSVLACKSGSDPAIEALIASDDFLSHTTSLPIVLDYATPETLGRDRIAAAVGAYTLDPGATWIVIDLGTCLTLDLVRDGEFKGGVISPGLAMRLRSMHEFTVGLPQVDFNDKVTFPGRSTEESMQVGVYQSIIHEIQGYIRQISENYGQVKIVDSSRYRIDFDIDLKNEIFARPKLVLEGLNHILEYNA